MLSFSCLLIQRRWIYYWPLLLIFHHDHFFFCFLWFETLSHTKGSSSWRTLWMYYKREEEEQTEAIHKGGGTLFWMKKREDAMFLSVAMTASNFPSSCPSLPDRIHFLCSFSHSMFITVTPNLDWTPNFSTFPMDHQRLNLID